MTYPISQCEQRKPEPSPTAVRPPGRNKQPRPQIDGNLSHESTADIPIRVQDPVNPTRTCNKLPPVYPSTREVK
jgi:hypothetical protein